GATGEASESTGSELSVDALGDALSDMSVDSTESALDALGAELGPDSFDAIDSAGESARPAPRVQDLAQEKVPLFSDFTPDEFVEVVMKMEHETYARDQVIVREGEPGDSLYVLVTGG